MDTIAFDRTWIDELTTLEKALEVYHEDKFLTVKKKLLGPEFDEETQTKIWQDYHNLFGKAVLGKFEKGDIERLEKYRRLEGRLETLSILTGDEKLYFPTDLIRDNAGQIVRVTYDFFDNEITKRWFNHIYEILVGREDVRVCAAEDCPNLFLKNRKNRKFCSEACRNRNWRKKYR
jgi:hypothetical protein